MFKRIGSFFLAFLLIITCAPLTVSTNAAEEYKTGSYRVTAAGGVHLYENPEISFSFRTTARKDAVINIIKTQGNFGYTLYDAVYGWVDLSGGLEYVSSTPSVTGTGRIEGTKGLRITRLPDKLNYIEGEESADIDGLEVSVVFNDDRESTMAVSGYIVSFPDLDTYGEKTVFVYYGGYRTNFDITVSKVPVTHITVTAPSKTSYIEGEAISFDGMRVTAYYSDGRDGGRGIVLKPEEYAIEGVKEGDTKLSPGTYKVTVTYKYPEITGSFYIYVAGKSVVSLKLEKLPANLTLYQGQTFKKSDFVLSATYDNGITETVTDFEIEYSSEQVGDFTARIYYMGRYVAFDYTVLPLEEVGIELGDTSAVGSYVGSDISFSRLQVYLVYNSGEKVPVSDYKLTYNIDINTEGTYPVTVTYGEFTATFNYTVAKKNDVMMGDVNLNGKIEAQDARLALRASARLQELDERQFLAADVDFDNKITAADARKILRVSARLDEF